MIINDSLRKNKSGNYTGIPTQQGKLYYSSNQNIDRDQILNTTQMATKFYDQTNLNCDTQDIPIFENESLKPKFDVKFKKVNVNLGITPKNIISQTKKYLNVFKSKINSTNFNALKKKNF